MTSTASVFKEGTILFSLTDILKVYNTCYSELRFILRVKSWPPQEGWGGGSAFQTRIETKLTIGPLFLTDKLLINTFIKNDITQC